MTFLEVNRIEIDCTDSDIVEAGMALASGTMRYDCLLEWIRAHEARL